jgi:hypothetical protein
VDGHSRLTRAPLFRRAAGERSADYIMPIGPQNN